MKWRRVFLKKKTVSRIAIFVIGCILFTFSIDLPVLGFKKLEFVKGTSNHQVIDYNWYGKEISRDTFEGSSSEALSLFQKQDKLQKIQVSIIIFTLMLLTLWWSQEKKRYIYGCGVIFLLLLIIDVVLVNKFS
ncbi:hypothetical protein [Halobacillus sp. H74]|uniref:hypothetical protein n=1 Tax=Halobacillus sp. H74 TaxID=3457436 RepID=UPI003FCD23CE